MAQILVVQVPAHFAFLPFGTYGITFDFITTNLRSNPPNGWGVKARKTFYRHVGNHLHASGLIEHPQGSVYHGPLLFATECWVAMYDLRGLVPLGIFSSTVRKIEMFHIHDRPNMICGDLLALGGAHSPQLIGPTPLGLIPNNVQANFLIPGTHLPPQYCRVTPVSQNPANWRT